MTSILICVYLVISLVLTIKYIFPELINDCGPYDNSKQGEVDKLGIVFLLSIILILSPFTPIILFFFWFSKIIFPSILWITGYKE